MSRLDYAPRLSSVRKFAAKSKINYPLALGTKGTKLLFSSSEVLPITVVVDRHGNVRTVLEGILLPEEFDESIKPLLSKSLR